MNQGTQKLADFQNLISTDLGFSSSVDIPGEGWLALSAWLAGPCTSFQRPSCPLSPQWTPCSTCPAVEHTLQDKPKLLKNWPLWWQVCATRVFVTSDTPVFLAYVAISCWHKGAVRLDVLQDDLGTRVTVKVQNIAVRLVGSKVFGTLKPHATERQVWSKGNVHRHKSQAEGTKHIKALSKEICVLVSLRVYNDIVWPCSNAVLVNGPGNQTQMVTTQGIVGGPHVVIHSCNVITGVWAVQVSIGGAAFHDCLANIPIT